ncbi:hypothetical protein [Pseudonocardia acidicola]|uniref:Uncharacterized protein n=1 Tax=Pseudonocardia acidicola TaxID=2724939 RepID=A0ABX1SKP4_9PSEU|nr:hypothetical protein [Pseudonocardia acidicola]NMI00724.1 hypothetical protein [Pseudonocardia acidicola]
MPKTIMRPDHVRGADHTLVIDGPTARQVGSFRTALVLGRADFWQEAQAS